MQVDDKLITYLEDLSFLTLSESERIRAAADLQNILNDISRIGELNTEGVTECTHSTNKVNVFRDDETGPPYDRELILKNAPFRNDEMFVAPKTVD